MEQNDMFLRRLQDLSRMAFQRDIVTFTDFLDLNELNMVHSHKPKDTGIQVSFHGGYEWAERQIAAFIPDALSYDWEFPIACIHIMPKSIKFSEPLTHRDYLGAILNLGIQRQVLGDLLIDEDHSAFVFVVDRFADFICQELTRVKHTMVLASYIQDPSELPKHKEECMTGTVASIRLDSVIALAFGSSRSSMLPFIEGGKVFVNGKLVVSNGYTLKEDDLISVRGKGKFRFGGISKQTKKGRQLVTVYKYI